jgi:hypothetical protein
MPFLPFISDESFEKIVCELLKTAKEAKETAEKNFNKNVIDPFSALFEMSGFGINGKTWEVNEKTRQAQKTLSNAIGKFHQTFLGSVGNWENLGTGNVIDLINREKGIIAEIKNKYNTVKGSDKIVVYKDLHERVMPKNSEFKGFTAYYVEIIPKSPKAYDHPFVPSNKAEGARCAENPLIRVIDGKSFYKKVTGEPFALELLFDSLPLVIKKLYPQSTFDELDYTKKYFKIAFGY